MNNKRLKLPNGFGSITKKSGRRRRPYEIRKFIDGRQKVIGYETTYESALAFLCEYNKNPLLFSPSEITFDGFNYHCENCHTTYSFNKTSENDYMWIKSFRRAR